MKRVFPSHSKKVRTSQFIVSGSYFTPFNQEDKDKKTNIIGHASDVL